MSTGWVWPLKLGELPLVLAGPILRKVTTDSVTVWFALLNPATVTITVSDDVGAILKGSRQSYAIGPNLHIVAVTASTPQPPRDGKLRSGVVYTYDASFVVAGKTKKLSVATDGADLSYLPSGLPSFSLPPTDRNKLRLIHGSCRHPNATGNNRDGGPDCLSLLDGLIKETAVNADLRPHQLLLTGDQIYADDVAGPLLLILTNTAKVLLGNTEEVMPGHPSMPGQTVGTKLPPYTRKKMSELAGLTSDAPFNHLFSLGEYICMYLFVWSDVLWDAPDALPDEFAFRDLLKNIRPIDSKAMDELLSEEIASLDTFKSTLKQVRKALANVPTYMILDDHEITDDFNMFMQFCGGVYRSDMGLRIIQNGLTAYALCQHWGNVPEDFFDVPANPAGLRLLKALDGKYPASYAANSPDIMRLVGVHRFEQMAAPPIKERPGVFAAYHDEGCLRFNYTIEWPTHQIIVTDTRTVRSFPKNKAAPELLPEDEIATQITKAGKPTGDRILIVVLSTNAPPVPVIRRGPEQPNVAHVVKRPDPWPDLYDSWELCSPPFDRLMAAISERLPLAPDGGGQVRTGAAIVLSGDVHASFTSRMLLQGASRFEDTVKQPVNMVVAQLVSSSLRNQTGATIDQHAQGYNYPSAFLVGKFKPEGFVGWNPPKGTTKVIGSRRVVMERSAPTTEPITINGPRTMAGNRFAGDVKMTAARDYGYRLDYLRARKEHPIPDWGKAALDPLPPTASEADRKKTAERFRKITANYRDYDQSESSERQMVGVNNIGEVTFDWAAKRVNHTIRWVGPKPGGNPGDTAVMLSTYVVSLDPADTAYKLDDVMPPVKP